MRHFVPALTLRLQKSERLLLFSDQRHLAIDVDSIGSLLPKLINVYLTLLMIMITNWNRLIEDVSKL